MDNEFWTSENSSAHILTHDAAATQQAECQNPLSNGSAVMNPQQAPVQQLPALQRTHNTSQLQQDFIEQQAAQQHLQQQQQHESVQKFERLVPTSRESIGIRARDLNKTEFPGSGLVHVDVGNPLRAENSGTFSVNTLRSPQSLYAPSLPQQQRYEDPTLVPVPAGEQQKSVPVGTYVSKTIINGDQQQEQQAQWNPEQEAKLETSNQELQRPQPPKHDQYRLSNSNTGESDIDPLAGYAIPSSVSSVASDERPAEETVLAPLSTQNNGSSVWPWVLAGFIVILSISVLVAAYIYQQKKSTSKVSTQSKSKTEALAKSQSEVNNSIRQTPAYQPTTASRIVNDTGDLVRATDATSS